jgi:hypothetical protein
MESVVQESRRRVTPRFSFRLARSILPANSASRQATCGHFAGRYDRVG